MLHNVFTLEGLGVLHLLAASQDFLEDSVTLLQGRFHKEV